MTVLIKFTETHSYYLYKPYCPTMSGHCTCASISLLIYKISISYRIDIAIFCQLRIDIVSKLKSWYRVITNLHHQKYKWTAKKLLQKTGSEKQQLNCPG